MKIIAFVWFSLFAKPFSETKFQIRYQSKFVIIARAGNRAHCTKGFDGCGPSLDLENKGEGRIDLLSIHFHSSYKNWNWMSIFEQTLTPQRDQEKIFDVSGSLNILISDSMKWIWQWEPHIWLLPHNMGIIPFQMV